jgi:hypothetical protein
MLMNPANKDNLKLEIWREIVRRDSQRNFGGMTQGALGVLIGPVEAATQANTVFAALYPDAPAKPKAKKRR